MTDTCSCPPGDCHGGHTINIGPVAVGLTDENLRIVADASHPDCHPDGQVRDMAAELLALRGRVAELEGERDKLARLLAAESARVAELEAQLDRVTDLFEEWAAEENEHRAAGEFGLAGGLHVAIEMLREAVHGTTEPETIPSRRAQEAIARADREDRR